ncbi:MAG: Uma2 family endonuclease [Eubacterium sp.]|nr:Uma2 family endonuclease [Eubacterium sp.]
MTIEEIRQKKKECGYTNEQLAALSGVPLGTLQKILGSSTKAPRYDTMTALSGVFESKKKTEYNAADRTAMSVCESSAGYAVKKDPVKENFRRYVRQGTYTIEDYLALPDEQRAELIDGMFYDMASPDLPHQYIVTELVSRLREYIRGKDCSCKAFTAPADVRLDMDNRTMVQPDVFIICDRNKVTRRWLNGSPDFVAEVLSPSTKNKDIFIKTLKYREAGTKELWLIDPMDKSILTYVFVPETKVKMYSFADIVPVMIYNGECQVDFSEISGQMADWFEDWPKDT